MREIIPFSIREFKKRIGKYNFVRKLKNPSRETIAQLIKNDEYMEDFNFSDVIVGYYKLPKELFYKNPYATYTEEDMRMYFDDIYFLCTKKNKNSKDITWWHHWGKKLTYYDNYSDLLFDYWFGSRDYMPIFKNLPNNGFKAKKYTDL